MDQDQSIKLTPLPIDRTPRCEKCSARLDGKQGWCGRCGWYPTLEIFLELDPWDREPAPSEEAEKKEINKIEAWRKLVPIWGWELIGGIFIALAITLLARILLPSHGNYRFVWTIAQIVVSAVVLLCAHLGCYVFAAMENERLTPLDIIARPITIWMIVGIALPATFWRVALALWALAALCFSPLVGGLANRDLMDWGGQPARISLVKAIDAQAQKEAAGINSLQDAIEAAAKQADSFAPSDNATATPAQPLLLVDCLILGFDPAGDDDFNSLLLAADVNGKLRFVGTVSQGIPPELRVELNQRLRKLEQPNPFIPCRLPATWIKPVLTCRVAAKEMSNSNKLVRPVFKQMLNDISVSAP